MPILPPNHLARIANFYSPKLKEFRYFLEKIVENCDESLRRANRLEADSDPTGGPLTYSFSAFTNTVQTLKDITGKLLPEMMPWSKIKALRHGTFLYLARNAMTHDGDTIVTMWVNGYYFVPSKIVREDQKGNVVEIIPPVEDVKQFCLEFAVDFINLIVATLEQVADDERLSMSILDIDDLDQIYQNNRHVPEFVIALMREQRSQIEQAMQSMTVPRIANAITLANEIAAYCNEQLANVSNAKYYPVADLSGTDEGHKQRMSVK